MVAVLVNLLSLWNVGAIFRTADAAGIENLFLGGPTPAPLDRFGKVRSQLHKVALGAEQSVPWGKCASASRLITSLKKNGYRIFAIEQSPRAIPYGKISTIKRSSHSLDLERCVLVVGNEVRGLPQSILQRCDKILEIPMHGKLIRHRNHPRESGQGKESLNVAVAFGIVAFHLIYVSKV